MLNAILDMETNDPDDFLALLLLLGHPLVKLKAITVTSDTPEQVGLVRQALAWFGVDIPVGAYDLQHSKNCVSRWHYEAYGNIPPSNQAEHGAEVLLEHCGEDTTLITGAPLKNLGAVIALAESTERDFKIGGWVAQGGFAGEGIIPPPKSSWINSKAKQPAPPTT